MARAWSMVSSRLRDLCAAIVRVRFGLRLCLGLR
jgi:hypothetical protein